MTSFWTRGDHNYLWFHTHTTLKVTLIAIQLTVSVCPSSTCKHSSDLRLQTRLVLSDDPDTKKSSELETYNDIQTLHHQIFNNFIDTGSYKNNFRFDINLSLRAALYYTMHVNLFIHNQHKQEFIMRSWTQGIMYYHSSTCILLTT